ncbi:MAG TPA: hypothetical protein VIW47_11225 [Nitrospiraceae bacterium]|jgi:hypothetical protein
MATQTKKKQDASDEPQDSGKKPVHVVSYSLGNNTYLQASVWEREVPNGGNPFTVYDVSVRKRMKVEGGEYKSLYSFRASELPILMRALARAEDFILETRRKDDVPF